MNAILITALLVAMQQAKTEEITFKGATDLTLTGELMLPEGNGPFPGVLLLPGSGPTDRDGNQPPMLRTDVLKQIAERLAQEGIATFRFDKRPVRRYMSSWPMSDPAKLAEYFSFENHVADVEAAYRAMTTHRGIVANRAAILGHSEGGLFTSWEAHQLKPAAIVLLATAGQTMEGVLRFQIGRNVAQPGVPDSLRKQIVDSNEEAMKSLIETGTLPARVHPGLGALYNATAIKLVRSYLTIDPVVPLAQYAGPVLVMNGARDIQVRADVDATRLYDALRKRSGGVQELVIVPGASHNFKEVKGDMDPAFIGPMVPAALDKIASWLAASLKRS